MFKALSVCTALTNKDKSSISGIDFQTYYMGISEMTAKGEDYAKLTFDNFDYYKEG